MVIGTEYPTIHQKLNLTYRVDKFCLKGFIQNVCLSLYNLLPGGRRGDGVRFQGAGQPGAHAAVLALERLGQAG